MITMATTNIVSLLGSPSPLVSFLHTALQDTDSDPDVYQRPAPSSESLGPPPGSRMGYPDSSTPTFDYGGPAGAREAYPAWSAERQIPLSKEEIEDIFLDLTQKFGFQRDSMRNMVRLFVCCHVRLGTVPRNSVPGSFTPSIPTSVAPLEFHN